MCPHGVRHVVWTFEGRKLLTNDAHESISVASLLGNHSFAGKQLMEDDDLKISWSYFLGNCWWGAKFGPTNDDKATHFQIKSGLVQKDNPLIRMALSLLSVSLANTDEHRTNAWMGSDMDWICLLFAGPEETLFPITTFLSILCNHTVLAHSENVEKKERKHCCNRVKMIFCKKSRSFIVLPGDLPLKLLKTVKESGNICTV